MTTDLPELLPGHWDTPEGSAIARDYTTQDRAQLRCGDMSDFALANRVFMADRSDIDLIVWQTAAKERIRWLSAKLAELEAGNAWRPIEDAEINKLCVVGWWDGDVWMQEHGRACTHYANETPCARFRHPHATHFRPLPSPPKGPDA